MIAAAARLARWCCALVAALGAVSLAHAVDPVFDDPPAPVRAKPARKPRKPVVVEESEPVIAPARVEPARTMNLLDAVEPATTETKNGPARKIGDHASELGLSRKQVADIDEAVAKLTGYQVDCRARMKRNDDAAQALLNADVKAKLAPAVARTQELITRNNVRLKELLEEEGDLDELKRLWRSNFDAMVDLKVDQIRAQRSVSPSRALDAVRTHMKANVNILVEMQAADVMTARHIHQVLTPDQSARWKAIKARVASAP